MSPSEVVRRENDSWATVLPSVGHLADLIATTDFVPKRLRGNAPAVAACILYGREIGIGPMESLQSIDVIDGSPSPNAELLRALVLAAGHSMRWVERTNTRAVVEGTRGDNGDHAKVAYSEDDARKAGLLVKDNWKKNPRAMLTARATSELCRLLFPDVVKGLSYLPDELEDGQANGQVNVVTGEIVASEPAPARRTARRASAGSGAAVNTTVELVPVTTAPVAIDEPPLDEPAVLPPETVTVAPPDNVTVTPPPNVTFTGPADPAKADLAARAMRHVTKKPKAADPEPDPEDPATPDTAPLDPNGPATRPQATKALILFKKCDWTDRDDRLRAASAIIGRQVGTFNDLTAGEAHMLIEALQYAAAADDPPAMLGSLVELAAADSGLDDGEEGDE